jgi:hypothetical protein
MNDVASIGKAREVLLIPAWTIGWLSCNTRNMARDDNTDQTGNSFAWPTYQKRLLRAGLAVDDVEGLVAFARQTTTVAGRFDGATYPPLLEYFHHVCRPKSPALYEALLGETVIWQVRGPVEGATRPVWALLYARGCPLDHIWIVLNHCFRPRDSEFVKLTRFCGHSGGLGFLLSFVHPFELDWRMILQR